MTSIYDLPKEIVLQIFQCYLKVDTSVNLLDKISNVCVRWRHLCFDSSLWVTYDGSLKFETMMMLSGKGCFRNTRNFKISAHDFLNDTHANTLFSELKNVIVIDLSNLRYITPKILLNIGSSCSKIREIKFGKLSDLYYPRRESKRLPSLLPYLSLRGFHLLSIDISFCVVKNFTSFITCIADCCPNLEELHLIDIRNSCSLFPTDIVQTKCQKLKVLRLDYHIVPNMKRGKEGFPNLELFTFEASCTTIMHDEMLHSILFNSLRLKALDATFCQISTDILCSLPASDLEILNLSKSEASYCSGLHEVMKKWCHSLKHVDLSCSSSKVINKALLDLISTPASPPLKELNLRFSQVQMDVVAKILEKCSQLQVLRLESCRNMDYEMRGVYNGKSELKVLKGKIKCYFKKKKFNKKALNEIKFKQESKSMYS